MVKQDEETQIKNKAYNIIFSRFFLNEILHQTFFPKGQKNNDTEIGCQGCAKLPRTCFFFYSPYSFASKRFHDCIILFSPPAARPVSHTIRVYIKLAPFSERFTFRPKAYAMQHPYTQRMHCLNCLPVKNLAATDFFL